MTRVDELKKKYPCIHKDIILKWEVMTNGISDSKDLDKVNNWRPASHGTYLSQDEELSHRDPFCGRIFHQDR